MNTDIFRKIWRFKNFGIKLDSYFVNPHSAFHITNSKESVTRNLQLFISALSQILRKIRQSHHDNSQSHNIRDINLPRKHPCQDDGKNSTDDSSDNENLKLIQFIGLFAVHINNYIFHHRDTEDTEGIFVLFIGRRRWAKKNVH